MASPASQQPAIRYVQRVLTRLAALGAVIAAVYVSVGSWLYGEWFFGFFWRGRALDWRYLQDGVEYQLENHPYGVVAVVLGGLFLAILANRQRKRLFPIIDRLWGWVCAASIVVIIVTAVLVHHRYKTEYVIGEALEMMSTGLLKMVDIWASPQMPILEAPIDFKYLDRNRIEALYSQVTPELLEKERSVATQGNRAAKVGMSGGPLAGELKTEKGSQTKSELQRVEFSPERKCMEVINFALTHNRARYYVDGSTWFANRVFAGVKQKIDQARREAVTKGSIEKLRVRSLDELPTAQEQEESRRQVEQYQAEFDTEMRGLTGLLLAEGEFQLSNQGAEQILTRQFSEKPRQIRFKIKVPSAGHLERLASDGRLRFHVFAAVDQPLGREGTIMMTAIAIY